MLPTLQICLLRMLPTASGPTAYLTLLSLQATGVIVLKLKINLDFFMKNHVGQVIDFRKQFYRIQLDLTTFLALNCISPI